MADADVWKECSEWFHRCGVELPEGEATPQNEETFVNYLHNGVVLCRLIHALDPEALDLNDNRLVCLKPCQMENLKKQNIKTFLQKCQSVFGLEESDLFKPEMLRNMDDFHHVFHTLSKLSVAPKVKALGITGFYIPSEHIYINDDINYPNQLEDQKHHPIYVTDADFFHHLIGMTNKREIVAPPLIADPLDRSIHKILSAEENYVSLLNVMEEKVIRPLSSVMSANDHSLIFYGFRDLRKMHQKLNDELKSVVEQNKSGTKLYKVFLNWKEKLYFYQEFAVNLPTALNLINGLYREKGEVARKVELIQAMLMDRYKLTHFLLQPIQHICQYNVLLKELRRNTPKTHEDYTGLKYAVKVIQDLTEQVHAIKQDSFILQALEHAQSTILDWEPTNPPLREFGRLFRDGWLKVSFSILKKQPPRKYYVFLLSRTVIFCTARLSGIIDGIIGQRNEQYTFWNRITLHNCIFEECVDLKDSDKEQNGPWTHSWRLMGSSGTTSIKFHARTAEDRQRWIESFKEVMAQLHPQLDKGSEATSHTFELHTFHSTVTCLVCRKLLKGLLDQGYRCTKCGQSFHRQCLKSSAQCGTSDDGLYSTIQDLQIITNPPDVDNPPQLEITSPVDYPSWFAGIMNASEANELLKVASPGTFLVRSRATNPDAITAPFALSIKTPEGVRHVKVCFRSQPDESNYVCLQNSHGYFIDSECCFATIDQLVDWYRQPSESRPKSIFLKTPFNMVHSKATVHFCDC